MKIRKEIEARDGVSILIDAEFALEDKQTDWDKLGGASFNPYWCGIRSGRRRRQKVICRWNWFQSLLMRNSLWKINPRDVFFMIVISFNPYWCGIRSGRLCLSLRYHQHLQVSILIDAEFALEVNNYRFIWQSLCLFQSLLMRNSLWKSVKRRLKSYKTSGFNPYWCGIRSGRPVQVRKTLPQSGSFNPYWCGIRSGRKLVLMLFV